MTLQKTTLSRPFLSATTYRARSARFSFFTLLTEGSPVDIVMDSGDQLRVDRHPEKSSWLRLYLPKALAPVYLERVRNIQGRRWDPKNKVWEIPYTRLTLRFLERRLGEVHESIKTRSVTCTFRHRCCGGCAVRSTTWIWMVKKNGYDFL